MCWRFLFRATSSSSGSGFSESLLDMKGQENNSSESVELTAAASASPDGAKHQVHRRTPPFCIASLFGFRPNWSRALDKSAYNDQLPSMKNPIPKQFSVPLITLSMALVLGFCGLVSAADDKVDPVGTWKCEYEIGGQPRTSTLTIKKDGDKLKGKGAVVTGVEKREFDFEGKREKKDK